MAFSSDDLLKFNQLFEQAMSDPATRASLKVKLDVPSPSPAQPSVPEPREVNKILEDKVYRRCDKYTGVAGTWQEWSFNFINATSGVNKTIGLILERIGQQCETQLTPDNLRKVVSDEICQKHGAELFGVLCSLTGGDANGVVRGILAKHNMRCGFAAYFMLNVRFNPKTPARALQFLHTVVNPNPIKDVRFIPKGIEDWEARRSVMEHEFGEKLSDRMAAAIVTAMLPLEFRDMIYQAQGAKDVIYEEVRDKVLSVAGCRIESAQPTPMDVGAVGKEEWGGDSAAEADKVNEEINQIKGNGKGSQCYRCGGYGHMAKTCGTPAPVKGDPKGQGKGGSYGDGGKGGKGYPKETRECYNCKKMGHLSKDCWAKGGGKAKGKGVNGVEAAPEEIGGVWMIAGVEGAQLTPLQANELWRNNSLTDTQISNYWNDLWSESEDEELGEEEDEAPLAGPPGIVTDIGETWKQTESIDETLGETKISKFDLLFRGKVTPTKVAQLPTVFEVVDDDEKVNDDDENVNDDDEDVSDDDEEWKNFKKAHGWDELEVCIIEVNGIRSEGPKVKIAIDSAAAESVCPWEWAEQFPVKPVAQGQEQSFVNASGGPIKHYGEKKVALLAKGSTGMERTIGLPFQACDVKRPLAAVWRICEKGNIVQFGPREADNFIQNVKSQEKIMLQKERGLYVMEASLVTDSPF